MTKEQFVNLVEKTGNYRTTIEAIRAVNSFTLAVTEVLIQRKEVHLVKFGSFKTTVQKEELSTDKTCKIKNIIEPVFFSV